MLFPYYNQAIYSILVHIYSIHKHSSVTHNHWCVISLLLSHISCLFPALHVSIHMFPFHLQTFISNSLSLICYFFTAGFLLFSALQMFPFQSKTFISNSLLPMPHISYYFQHCTISIPFTNIHQQLSNTDMLYLHIICFSFSVLHMFGRRNI